MNKVLIAGATGGREHALGMTIGAFEPEVELEFSHGNPGTANLGKNHGLASQASVTELVDLADSTHSDLVVVGPEAPLVAGLADRLRDKGIPTFGPGAEGAQLEASKIFATHFMRQYGIEHPVTKIPDSPSDALYYVNQVSPASYVIKADGLAGGKGVVLPKSQDEAEAVVRAMMSGELYKGAGKKLLFQERLHGPEVSMFAIMDGKKANLLLLSQDHKRLQEGDKGPNTGGMGAYAPVPNSVVSERQRSQMQELVGKTLEGLSDRGIDYRGVLYFGLMLAEERDDQPTVIEYNVRFGDPEAQVILPSLRRARFSIHEQLYSAAQGDLAPLHIPKELGFQAMTVCLAAPGYPDSPRTGDEIHGLRRVNSTEVRVFHGGTAQEDRKILTAGGRVLYLMSFGSTFDEAAGKIYGAIGNNPEDGGVYFDGMQYRSDIGWQVRSGL